MKWSRLAQSVNQTLLHHALARKRDRLVLAVSGGLDSVVLLHLMLELQPAWEWELILGHIDHGLRPSADPQESAFCRALAEAHCLPYLEEKLKLMQKSAQQSAGHRGTEALARERRYAVFEKWVKDCRADALMTGHHAGDQAETILYRMLTGAGIAGLQGIPRKRGIYRRPLLDIPRSELQRYATEHDLKYCEDISNRDQRFVRNRIRHRLMPLLAELGFRNAENALAASAASLESAAETREHYTAELKAEALKKEASALRLDLVPYRRASDAVQRALLQEFFTEHLSRRQAEQLQRFILNAECGRTTRLQGRRFIKERDALICDAQSEETDPLEIKIADSATIRIPQGKLQVRAISADRALLSGDPHSACFSPKILSKTLRIRSWRDGDRMRLFGRGEYKKLSDILKDEKVPASIKKTYPLVLIDDTIVWIPGVKRSGEYILEKEDKDSVMITYTKSGENHD